MGNVWHAESQSQYMARSKNKTLWTDETFHNNDYKPQRQEHHF